MVMAIHYAKWKPSFEDWQIENISHQSGACARQLLVIETSVLGVPVWKTEEAL